MAQGTGSINSDYKDWEWSADAGERARLLQSPSVETVPKSGESQGNGLGATSALGAVFIVVNAALGAGLLNFPAAFNMAGGVAAGIALQMVRGWRRDTVPPWEGTCGAPEGAQGGPGSCWVHQRCSVGSGVAVQGWFWGPRHTVASVSFPCLVPNSVHVDLHHRRLGHPGILLAGQQRADLPGGRVGCLREGAWCAV